MWRSNVVISWNVLRAAAEVSPLAFVPSPRISNPDLVHSSGSTAWRRHPLLTSSALCSASGLSSITFPSTSCIQHAPTNRTGCRKCELPLPFLVSLKWLILISETCRIAEMQADTIVRRYRDIRVASLRLHWSVPSRAQAFRGDYEGTKGDLWSYVQEDSSAEAFIRALTVENDEWKGHEAFFIVAPRVAADEDWLELKKRYFPDVPVREGWVESGGCGFFDCSKAERILGWVHKDYA